MKFVCDACGARYHIDDKKVRGKILRIRCKKCSHVITVREPARVSRPTPSPAAAAPVQAKVDWFYSVNGQSSGPVEEEALLSMFAAGRVGDEAYVWNAGFSEWKPAFDVPVFSSAIAKWKQAARLAGKPATEQLTALQVDELKLESRALPAFVAREDAEHEVFAQAKTAPTEEEHLPEPKAEEPRPEPAVAEPAVAEPAAPEPAAPAEPVAPTEPETPAEPALPAEPQTADESLLEETQPIARPELVRETAADDSEDAKPTVDLERDGAAEAREAAAQRGPDSLDELSTSGVQRLLADKEKSGMAASQLEKLRSALRTRRTATPASGTASLDEPQTSSLSPSPSQIADPAAPAEEPAAVRSPLGAAAALDLPGPPQESAGLEAPTEEIEVPSLPAGPTRQTEAPEDSAGAQALADLAIDTGAPLAPTPTVNLDAPDGETAGDTPAEAPDTGAPLAPTPTVNLEAPDDGAPLPATPTVNLEADQPGEVTGAEAAVAPSVDADSAAGFGALAAQVSEQAPIAGVPLEGLSLGTGSVAIPEASPSDSLLFQVKQARAGKRKVALGALLLLLAVVSAIVFVSTRPDPPEPEPVVEVEPEPAAPVVVESNAASEAQTIRNLQVATIRAGRAIGAAWTAAAAAATPAPEEGTDAGTEAEERPEREERDSGSARDDRDERSDNDERADAAEEEEEAAPDTGRIRDRNGLALPTPRVGPSEERSEGPAPDHFNEGMRTFINSSIARCNQRHIAEEGELEQPRVEISITVLPSGRVRDLELARSLRETAFGRCLQSHRERWLFPSFEGDSVTLQKTYVVQ